MTVSTEIRLYSYPFSAVSATDGPISLRDTKIRTIMDDNWAGSRTAFQLGLHSPKASSGLSPIEHEIRIRTFYGCVIWTGKLSPFALLS